MTRPRRCGRGDQQLVQLVGIGLNGEIRTGGDVNCQPLFKAHHTFYPLCHPNGSGLWRGQTREARMGTRKPVEGIAAIGNHVQAGTYVIAPVVWQRLMLNQGQQA